MYLPSGSPAKTVGVFPLVHVMLFSVTLISLSEVTSASDFSPVSVRIAPGSSAPAISFLLIVTFESSSTITTFSVVGTPFLISNVIASVIVYPSGATLSSSVYLPSGRPSRTVGVSPLVHFTVLPAIVRAVSDFTPVSGFSPVSIRVAPGISAPVTSCLLTVTFENSSTITIFVCVGTPFLISNVIASVIVYPSGATLSSSVYLPSGRPSRTVGVSPLIHVTLFPSTFISVSEVTSVSGFSPVSIRVAPGISAPVTFCLLVVTFESSSTITIFSVVGTPFSISNVIASVIVYPSGATLSSSVYLPSGSPLRTVGVSPLVHVTLFPSTVISVSEVIFPSGFSPVSIRVAPGISFPVTFCLLIVVSESSSTIITAFCVASTLLSVGCGTVAVTA